MNTEQARNTRFQKAGREEWVEAAKKSLKKDTIGHLYKKTYEGITLNPLYTKADAVCVDQYPGEGSYVRGFHAAERQRWRISQRIAHSDWNELKKQIGLARQRGQDTISFDPDQLNNMEELSFTALNDMIALHQAPLFVLSKSNYPLIARKLLEYKGGGIFGAVATDIISSHLQAGRLVNIQGEEMDSWLSAVQELDEQYPEIKTILVDVEPYNAGGGNAVQELGTALATAVFYLEKMKEIGWPPEKTASKLLFNFVIGSQFFIEIAKLRAFRMLWKTLSGAYGMSNDQNKVLVSAETSEFTKSAIDPYVNMLRAGSEAFSAVVGGVDFLHVAPFDYVTTEWNSFSERIARNTQLLLKHESYLDKVADPSGGSYYIESLTKGLVEKGWAFFLEIDKNGGITESLQSGWLQKQIKETAHQRLKDSETRKQSIIGVNVYAVSTENVEEPLSRKNLGTDCDSMRVEPLPRLRLSQSFENIRKRTKNLANKGFLPEVGLIGLGPLKEYKPRADFADGVLAAAGIRAQWSNDCHSLDDMKAFIKKKQYKYYCLCGSDAMYQRLAAQIAHWLKEHIPGVHVDIAGRYANEELAAFGLDGTLYSGQNMYEKLSGLLSSWEDEING
ncbi:methylmalonyl-CoA mutase family protein [Siminovitchia sp. FSL H7-0308]|uniref:methylmalonyl-CoA mutase family protein n=1 Tax=Siminovitchia sp. FSL H7-0308 TaxID=2921432 RepID=UPI0030EC1B67